MSTGQVGFQFGLLFVDTTTSDQLGYREKKVCRKRILRISGYLGLRSKKLKRKIAQERIAGTLNGL